MTHPAYTMPREHRMVAGERADRRLRHPDLNRPGAEVVDPDVVDPVAVVEAAFMRRERGAAAREWLRIMENDDA